MWDRRTLSPRERFLRACRREPVDQVPVWLMRQAGRYMPEYQAVRAGRSFLELCKSPELCRDVALQPIRAFGLEIAIVFSDILLPAEAMGCDLVFDEDGPKIRNPVRDRAQVEALRDFDAAAATPWPAQALALTAAALGPDRPVIGFCGAPFTLACYMIEGRGSRNYENTKRMLYGAPETLHLLLERLTDNLVGYVEDQIAAGATAVQIFDSWAGCLTREDYIAFAHPYTKKLVQRLARHDVPIISFVNGCAHVLDVMVDSGAQVLSIDECVDPAIARSIAGDKVAIQGNMDPTALLATPAVAERETRKNLEAFGHGRGHVFNLGSGILKWTPPECVHACVKAVQGWS
jgi:uroporphyrinogen decarboxylase